MHKHMMVNRSFFLKAYFRDLHCLFVCIPPTSEGWISHWPYFPDMIWIPKELLRVARELYVRGTSLLCLEEVNLLLDAGKDAGC